MKVNRTVLSVLFAMSSSALVLGCEQPGEQELETEQGETETEMESEPGAPFGGTETYQEPAPMNEPMMEPEGTMPLEGQPLEGQSEEMER